MKPIKVGLVGLGRAGWGMHTDEYDQRSDKYQIVACCDVLPERNQKMAERYNCRTYASIEELVKDEEVELVDIATRTCDHYAHARIALEAGKDVVLEKPMCANYDQAADLFSRANKPGTPRLFIRQQRRFEGIFETVCDVINSGKLGKIYEINISQLGFQHRDDWQTIDEFGGGQMLNWGPHLLDHAVQLLGSPVANLECVRRQVAAGGDCEDHFNIYMLGENGISVNVSISGATALNQGRKFVIYGDRGALISTGSETTIHYIDPAQEIPEVVSDPGTPGAAFGATGTYASAIDVKWVDENYKTAPNNLNKFWDCLYDSYRNNAPFPIKEEDVLALMKVISDAKAKSKLIKL